jgi:hypothetical protein
VSSIRRGAMCANHYQADSLEAYRRTTHSGTACTYPTFLCKICNKIKAVIGSKGSGKTKRCRSCDEEMQAEKLAEAEEGLPEHKKTGYAERMAEAADMLRDRMREERLLNGKTNEDQNRSRDTA